MKEIVINNQTPNEIIIKTNEDLVSIASYEKQKIKTNSETIQVKKRFCDNAKIMLALEHDKISGPAPGWGFRIIYVNTFDSIFNINDVFKEVIITEDIFLLNIALFTVLKVKRGKEEIQTFCYRNNKERRLFRFYRLFSETPLIAFNCIFIISIILNLLEGVTFSLVFLLLFMLIICIVHRGIIKNSKAFYNISENTSIIMKKIEEVKVVLKKKWIVKYKVLTEL